MGVRRDATLNIDQTRFQFLRQLSRAAAANDKTEIGSADFSDRRHYSGSTACERFDESSRLGVVAPLVDRIGFLAPAMFLGVKEYNLIVPCLHRFGNRNQTGSIVATAFRSACPTRACAVVMLADPQ